jgi:glyoxylase I family protein
LAVKGLAWKELLALAGCSSEPRDPVAIARWYQEHLGVTLSPETYDELPWWEAGPTVFTPFPEATPYFGNPALTFDD